MSNQSTARPFRLREFRLDDIPAFTGIINRTFPDEPTTVENMEHWERIYPKDNPRLRYIVEWEDGHTIAVGACFNPFWMTSPGAYMMEIFVDPDYRGHGVGLTALELPESGPAITGSTGVLPEHRGRGVAMALKLLSFRYARKRGYHEVRAHNDTANPPILRMNEKLGYRRLPGWLAWEKLPHRDQST